MQMQDAVHHYSDSALWLITQEPVLNEFICYLKDKKDRYLEEGLRGQELVFQRAQVQEVRRAFDRMVCRGEEKLHRLCGLLGEAFLAQQIQLKSVVIAELPGTRQRLKLQQDIDKAEIYERTDLDLGNWLMEKLRYQGPLGWEKPRLVANFVEYQALHHNRHGINKMISRIKAEEEIWAKVVDEIFQLDKLVIQDKQLRELSYFIKDVFGVKIVVDADDQVNEVFEALNELRWSSETLALHGVPAEDYTHRLRLLEVKDHLGEQKESGWQAMKVVYSWWSKTFEIQVQTMNTFLREQERLTSESHAAFKERREKVRLQVAAQIPLFGFYLQLLKWLFIHPESDPPALEGVNIRIKS